MASQKSILAMGLQGRRSEDKFRFPVFYPQNLFVLAYSLSALRISR